MDDEIIVMRDLWEPNYIFPRSSDSVCPNSLSVATLQKTVAHKEKQQLFLSICSLHTRRNLNHGEI